MSSINNNISGFMKDYKRLELSGLTLRSLSDELYSDFHRGESLYRYQAKDVMMDIIQGISDQTSVMLTNPNAYTLGFADYIIDLSTDTSHFLVIDYEIPFYQIAIAGKVSYAMHSINIDQIEVDMYYLLKAIETGSNLKFTVSYEDTAQLINTRFNTYFSTEYSLIEQKMLTLYDELYQLIGDDNYIVSHSYVSPSEIKVTYHQGQIITLNYQNLSYTVE